MDPQGSRLEAQGARGRQLQVACAVMWTLGMGPFLASASAQQLLDRVVATVNGTVILQTDVRAAIGLGVADAAAVALEQIVDRQVQLAEVARFPPPEPTKTAIDEEVARLTARAGESLTALMSSTGINEERLREVARESLRIQAYLDQRFGVNVPINDDQALQYFRDHPDEFRRNGVMPLFEDVAEVARQRASVERRRSTINQWLRDLRSRAEIVIVPGPDK